MVPVQLMVDDADVDVSTDAGRWRLHAPNRIFLRPDTHGRRVIVGIGDHGDVTGTAESSSVVQAFAGVDFDPDIAVSATRFWSWEAVQKGHRRSVVRTWLTRASVQLVWSAWPGIPIDARRRYLRQVVRFVRRELHSIVLGMGSLFDLVLDGMDDLADRLYRLTSDG
jgi:hypothetical protein